MKVSYNWVLLVCNRGWDWLKAMLVRRETMSIVWQRALSGRNSFDGAVDIRYGYHTHRIHQ